jgi:hypothetical protein
VNVMIVSDNSAPALLHLYLASTHNLTQTQTQTQPLSVLITYLTLMHTGTLPLLRPKTSFIITPWHRDPEANVGIRKQLEVLAQSLVGKE